MSQGPISNFIQHHYRHFNAAALMDAAKGYVTHLDEGGKMMITLAGAMSTAELGLSLAEMIRQDKVAIISCTGATDDGHFILPDHFGETEAQFSRTHCTCKCDHHLAAFIKMGYISFGGIH